MVNPSGIHPGLTIHLILSMVLTFPPLAAGQSSAVEDRPKILPPSQPTADQKKHAEALKLYARAALLERESQLIEALKTYEAAAQIDPDSPAILRGLIPLYFAIDRSEEAFAACDRLLKLDPDDCATGYLYARHLRLHERSVAALIQLQRLVQRPGLKANPELHLRVSFDRGQMHEDRKEWSEAIAAYRQTTALLQDPEELLQTDRCSPEELDRVAAETYEHLGRIYLKVDQTAAATTAFAEARQRDPARAPHLAFMLAEVLSNKGEWKNALDQLDDYLRSQPLGLDGYELKIKLLRKLNRPAEIIPALEQACNRDKYNIGLKLLLAKELRLANRKTDAEHLCLELTRDRPTSEVYRELFAIFYEEGAPGGERALDLLNEAIDRGTARNNRLGDAAAADRARALLAALREEGALAHLILAAIPSRLKSGPPLATPTLMLFGSLALKLRQLNLAEEIYRTCRKQPDHTESEVSGGLLRVLALAHKQEAILEACQQGLKEGAKSNRAMYHLEMSQAYLNLEQDKDAMAQARAAVLEAGEAEDLLSRRNHVLILSQLGKHAEAIAECQAMQKEYSQSGEQRDIRSTLAVVYQNAGDLDRAEQQLQQILDADPGDAITCNDLGYQLADRGKNLPEAEKLIRKAIELDGKQRREGSWTGLKIDLDNAAYVDSLGWALFRQGKLKEARKEFLHASQLPSGADDPTVWSHLGDVHLALGEKPEALAAWGKALHLYDNHQRRRDDLFRELTEKLRKSTP